MLPGVVAVLRHAVLFADPFALFCVFDLPCSCDIAIVVVAATAFGSVHTPGTHGKSQCSFSFGCSKLP